MEIYAHRSPLHRESYSASTATNQNPSNGSRYDYQLPQWFQEHIQSITERAAAQRVPSIKITPELTQNYIQYIQATRGQGEAPSNFTCDPTVLKELLEHSPEVHAAFYNRAITIHFYTDTTIGHASADLPYYDADGNLLIAKSLGLYPDPDASAWAKFFGCPGELIEDSRPNDPDVHLPVPLALTEERYYHLAQHVTNLLHASDLVYKGHGHGNTNCILFLNQRILIDAGIVHGLQGLLKHDDVAKLSPALIKVMAPDFDLEYIIQLPAKSCLNPGTPKSVLDAVDKLKSACAGDLTREFQRAQFTKDIKLFNSPPTPMAPPRSAAPTPATTSTRSASIHRPPFVAQIPQHPSTAYPQAGIPTPGPSYAYPYITASSGYIPTLPTRNLDTFPAAPQAPAPSLPQAPAVPKPEAPTAPQAPSSSPQAPTPTAVACDLPELAARPIPQRPNIKPQEVNTPSFHIGAIPGGLQAGVTFKSETLHMNVNCNVQIVGLDNVINNWIDRMSKESLACFEITLCGEKFRVNLRYIRVVFKKRTKFVVKHLSSDIQTEGHTHKVGNEAAYQSAIGEALEQVFNLRQNETLQQYQADMAQGKFAAALETLNRFQNKFGGVEGVPTLCKELRVLTESQKKRAADIAYNQATAKRIEKDTAELERLIKANDPQKARDFIKQIHLSYKDQPSMLEYLQKNAQNLDEQLKHIQFKKDSETLSQLIESKQFEKARDFIRQIHLGYKGIAAILSSLQASAQNLDEILAYQREAAIHQTMGACNEKIQALIEADKHSEALLELAELERTHQEHTPTQEYCEQTRTYINSLVRQKQIQEQHEIILQHLHAEDIEKAEACIRALEAEHGSDEAIAAYCQELKTTITASKLYQKIGEFHAHLLAGDFQKAIELAQQIIAEHSEDTEVCEAFTRHIQEIEKIQWLTDRTESIIEREKAIGTILTTSLALIRKHAARYGLEEPTLIKGLDATHHIAPYLLPMLAQLPPALYNGEAAPWITAIKERATESLPLSILGALETLLPHLPEGDPIRWKETIQAHAEQLSDKAKETLEDILAYIPDGHPTPKDLLSYAITAVRTASAISDIKRSIQKRELPSWQTIKTMANTLGSLLERSTTVVKATRFASETPAFYALQEWAELVGRSVSTFKKPTTQGVANLISHAAATVYNTATSEYNERATTAAAEHAALLKRAGEDQEAARSIQRLCTLLGAGKNGAQPSGKESIPTQNARQFYGSYTAGTILPKLKTS